MFQLHQPSDAEIRRLLDEQRELPLTYPGVGLTRTGQAPAGYPLNRHRIRLGAGRGCYDRGVAALRGWAMYRLSWTRLCWPDVAPEPGAVVAAVVRHFGFWSINPCRVVYQHEGDQGEVRVSAFAIGTLPAHGERGEERFRVAWYRADDSVWFDLFAFAGANHWLPGLGFPLLRMLQRRFGRESLQAMRRTVAAHE